MTDATAQQNFERRRTPKRRALQRTIIQAAQRILEQKDPSAMTIEDIAAEAGLPTETVAECFRNKNELLLSMAAQELAGLARATYSDERDERQWMAASSSALSVLRAARQILATPAAEPKTGSLDASPASSGTPVDQPETTSQQATQDVAKPAGQDPASEASSAPRLTRKPIRTAGASITPELGQLLTDLTAEDGAGHGTGATISRLERRLGVIERAVADRPAEPAHEKANASVLVDESVTNLSQKLKALEKQQAEMRAEVRVAVSDLGGRVQLLEAMPPAATKDDAKKRLRDETDFPDSPLELPSAPEHGWDSEETVQKPLDDLLATARRAAKEAAAKAQPAQTPRRASTSFGRTLSNTLGLRKPGGRKRLVLTCLAPVPVIAVAFMTGYRDGQESRAAALAQQTTAAEADGAAVARLVQMASVGDPRAELLLGLRYLTGEDVPRDEAEAFHWLEKSSGRGQALAQYWLANLLAREKSARANPAEAARWYEAAAKQGNRMAMNNLAVAHAHGVGTKKSVVQAAHWFNEAAKLGYAVSQFNLAVLYERGEGVPQNLVEAYKWYAVAAAQGDAEARKRVDTMASELKPEELTAAQAAAANFQPAPMDRAANFAPQWHELQGG